MAEAPKYDLHDAQVAISTENKIIDLTYETELKPGEKLTLPESVTNNLSPGHWVITIRRQPSTEITKTYDAFLNSYAPEDEGLYDDY
ncbi:hypothetical protein NIES4071_73850 [Calothrix sp. NIES-4071]|nr:hypothetical protein NIES4071_73850 [Calothrix sp. NIES-4071]BAZ61660.1 hypothetical protein NIES4105_73800 [Calothrix sp. NIES-4105]